MLHVLRRHQLFDSGSLDVVAGALLSRAIHVGGMSLAEMQAAASIMQRSGRREDMRAFQAYFVRAVLDRQQLHGTVGKRQRRPKETEGQEVDSGSRDPQ